MPDLATLDPYKRSDIQIAARLMRSFEGHQDELDEMIGWLFDAFKKAAKAKDKTAFRRAITCIREVRGLLALTMSLRDIPTAVIEHRHEHEHRIDAPESEKSLLLTALDRIVDRLGEDPSLGENL